jgi:PAS domain S-box-containing protein
MPRVDEFTGLTPVADYFTRRAGSSSGAYVLMSRWIVEYRLDWAALALILCVAAAMLCRGLRGWVRAVTWGLIALLLIGGAGAAELAGSYSPTYEQELAGVKNARTISVAISRADALSAVGVLGAVAIAAAALLGKDERAGEAERAAGFVARDARALQLLVDLEPQCVCVLGASGEIQEINPAGIDLLGAKASEKVIGQHLSEWVAEEDRARFAGMCQSVTRGHAAALQMQLVASDGKRRWTDGRFAPVRNDARKVGSIIGIVRDLTPVRQAQAQRDELARELVAASTRVELAIDGEKIDELASFLTDEQNAMFREIARVARGVWQIRKLALARGSASSAGVEETFAISSVVDEVVRIGEGLLERHEIEVERRYADCPPVTLDRHRLVQILAQLLLNAERSEATMVTIELAWDAEREVAELSMCDNGMGIPADLLPHVFEEPLAGEGFGFELHAAARAVRELGGSLLVQSDGPGRGSTFILALRAPSASRASHAAALEEAA